MSESNLGRQINARPLTEQEIAARPSGAQLEKITNEAYRLLAEGTKIFLKRFDSNHLPPKIPFKLR